MKQYLYPANILLPDFASIDGTKWASVACDQYTSQPDYWDDAYSVAGNSPSTLHLMLPEAYLDREEALIPKINKTMEDYLKTVLREHKNSMIYLERTQSDGRVRRGLIGAVDLENYDFRKGSETITRATEGTVLERIPPRVAIRRGAALEMPHIMILIDDPKRTVIEPVAAHGLDKVAYDFALYGAGGHVKGCFVKEAAFDGINEALSALATPAEMQQKYRVDAAPLLFAIGDGNHSLASAKALYREIQKEIGEEAAKNHPARFALCEIVNLHDEALDFEPIYRVVYGVDPTAFWQDFTAYCASLQGSAEPQAVRGVWQGKQTALTIEKPVAQLAVGTVQAFLDDYIKSHPNLIIDYIHGEDAAISLAQKENTAALLFDGMTKDMLFKTVICDGALPRKTFSMGHAADKRFYLECRRIR